MTSDQDRLTFEKALRTYLPSSDEQVFQERMINLLDYPNCFERCLLQGHFTASAWVIDLMRKKALLTHHAKLDKWLQLGGHADGETNMPNVAFRELSEESGRADFVFFNKDIFDIDIHTIPERKGVPQHEHYDVRYLFIGDSTLPLERNEESKALAWVPFKDVLAQVDRNDSIARMMNKTQKKML